MDPKHLEHQLNNSKLRQSYMEKRSKFLKQWRERWVVITHNYLFTFKSSSQLTQPTDILDLRQIKSVKSYVKKYGDKGMSGFKLSSEDSTMYFRCLSVPEKWSWLVFFQRLLQHKNNGSTFYNSYDLIMNEGFQSVRDYEKSTQPSEKKEIKKAPGYDLGQVLKAEQLKSCLSLNTKAEGRKIEDTEKKQQMIRMEVNNKTDEQIKKCQQLQLQIKKSQQYSIDQKDQKNQLKAQIVVQKNIVENLSLQFPQNIDISSKRFSQLKRMFEKNIKESCTTKHTYTAIQTTQSQSLKKKEKSLSDDTNRRNTIITQMFNEFNLKNTNSFKYIVEFLVGVAADLNTGFAPYIMHQCRQSDFKSTFAEIFVQYYTQNPQQKDVRPILGFLDVVYYQCPSLFSFQQTKSIKQCLVRFISSVKNMQLLSETLKTVLKIHRSSSFNLQQIRKNTNIIRDLEVSSKSQAAIGVARKVKEMFGLIY